MLGEPPRDGRRALSRSKQLQPDPSQRRGVGQVRADWQQSIALPDLLPTRPFILNVGTLEHKKGQDVLVRAFEDVARAFRRLELVMVECSGP